MHFGNSVKVGLHDALAGAEAGDRPNLEPVINIELQIQSLAAQIDLQAFVGPVHRGLVSSENALTGASSRAAVVDTDVGIGLSLRVGLITRRREKLARADLVDRTCRTETIDVGQLVVIAGAEAIERLPQQVATIKLIVHVAIGGVDLGALQEALALLS